MRNLKYIGLSLAIALGLGFSGCGEGGGDSSTPTPETSTTYSLSGSAQKGPLIFGSYIWVAELDTKLNTTGNIHVTQTTDDLGNFAIGSKINTQLVEIIADGYFMDETTGSLSSGKITLSAIADLKVDSSPTVNILTTLQGPRLTILLESMDYETALAQSQKEVLAMFGIDASKVNNLDGLFAMQINGSGDSDAVLLATSAIMMQMATTEAQSTGASKAAELSYFISQIGNDVSSDGKLDDTTIQTKLATAATNVNLSSVRNNIQTYYSNKGVIITAPKFEEWVDKDNSDLLPRRQLTFSDVSFNNLTNIEALQTYTSNAYTISGAGNGTYVYVDSSVSGSIIKNGSVVTGQYTTAVDGDTVAFKITSGAFDQNVSTRLTVGANVNEWVINTKKPTVKYKSVDGNCPFPGCGIPGDDPEVYHAFPLLISETFVAKYIGSSFAISNYFNTGTNLEKVSIYSDNAGIPGTELITTTNFNKDYFGSSDLNFTNGTSQTSLSSLASEIYLGNTGLSLTNGDKVWVVYKFASATDLGNRGNSPVGFSARKVSSDGANWTDYHGLAFGRYSDNMPMVLITD